ncbi:MAG: PEP-CTERM sorting domain-containing protein [Planctomycetes bacterium]|nr:PEP-CTERM sorting domain-containing protein [Planctomycetota bacterium]
MKKAIHIVCVVVVIVGLGSPGAVPASAGLREQKVVACDAGGWDVYGVSVSGRGVCAIIGAWGGPGSPFVVRRSGGTWREEAKLTASDGVIDNSFGGAVSVDGDYAIVGSKYDGTLSRWVGSAYIFERNASEAWPQRAKVLASDGVRDDWFGQSVSISGDYAIVGAYGDDDNDEYSGSAYIFERNASGTWMQEAKLLASDGASMDHFGCSVSISNNYAIVGAKYNDEKGSNSGSAYIYERQAGGTWTQKIHLTALGGTSEDRFGYSVSLSGDRAIVGAPSNDSAYIFVRDTGGTWMQQAQLTASDGGGTSFGWSVAIDGNHAAIGAIYDEDNGNDSGSAYIFEQDISGSWTEIAKVTASDGDVEDLFGWSVSISGDSAIVGAYGNDDVGSNSGSAYIYGNVPEPATLGMLALGGLAMLRRRRRGDRV